MVESATDSFFDFASFLKRRLKSRDFPSFLLLF